MTLEKISEAIRNIVKCSYGIDRQVRELLDREIGSFVRASVLGLQRALDKSSDDKVLELELQALLNRATELRGNNYLKD